MEQQKNINSTMTVLVCDDEKDISHAIEIFLKSEGYNVITAGNGKEAVEILKEKEIVRVKGINPKYWLFDEYNFQRLDDDDEIFHLLCNFEDVDFDKYFTF